MKKLILNSFDVLITSLQKEFAPYVKSVVTIMLDQLVKDPYSFGLRIVGSTLHKLLVTMKSVRMKNLFFNSSNSGVTYIHVLSDSYDVLFR